RGGLCLSCDLREKDLYNYDSNAYSFDNFNYFPQSQDENYLCNLCGNNSHDGYDCQQQFSFVYEQEPSYNQNYDDNYYPHESPSFPCFDYCGGSHETFQCQPDNQNIEFSGSDQIQTLQYPDVNPPSPEINSNELFQKLLKDLKELAEYDQSTSTDRPIFLNDNEDHPVQNRESPENSSKENVVSKTNQEPPQNSDIHQLIEECCEEVPEEQKQNMEKTMLDLKLFKDLKELAEYDQTTSTNRPIFLNDNEDHPVQNRESPENSSKENIVSKTNQEPPQDSNIHQLIDECCKEVPEEQKQNIEKTNLDLVKICHHKQFLCIHDDVNNLIESALESKLLSINSINSQRLDKKDQEVKNVEEQLAERRNHTESDDESFEDIEYVDASVPNPAIVSVEEENVVQREEEEVEDISQVQDVVLCDKLLSITRLIY
nr:hypothetical protein [Tanacetum cinerariifolium]